jgi:hypothetical protein
MELIDPRITILVNEDTVRIHIRDTPSLTKFIEITLTPVQFTKALSRLGDVECTVKMAGLDKVGKTHEHKEFIFAAPKIDNRKNRQSILERECSRALIKAGMTDWTSDNYYDSQNTFFRKPNDDTNYVRVTIRRWI